MKINDAVKELRLHLGESQQAFAGRLGLSIRAIANYEKDRVPSRSALTLLIRQAVQAGREDLSYEFRRNYWGEEMKINDAVRALRVRLGDTQQQFAARLGLAISTVVRYESTRPPKLEGLGQLHAIAMDHSMEDVAQNLEQAVLDQLRCWKRCWETK